ncbi:MAG: hypothetical protein P4L46_15130 [Fimbriimonas sp.]|nr:hypothetical protein [Fimbriimonas sp.]
MFLLAVAMTMNRLRVDDGWIVRVRDSIVRTGVKEAMEKNLLPAATEKVYPGHFCINADGGGFGSDTTWPGLDSWQMAGAYLLMGRTRMVKDYFDFVRASQRADGNIPFAIFTGDTQAGDTYLRGMRNPEDRFTYKPPVRAELPATSQETRQWVGLFRHWELESNPLATLGPICYVLTAREIEDATKDKEWLKEHIGSVEATGRYLMGQISPNGLLSGSGFYTEKPPRNGWDGVTQCYAVEAFHDLARLERSLGRRNEADQWTKAADNLSKHFRDLFWKDDHFGEYIHVERGLVDSHGLSDTNWAAIAFGLATKGQTEILWPRLIADKAFWPGNMPTATVTKPFAYQDWEDEKVPFAAISPTNDVASMGRTWYVESLACKRMGARERLIESARLVSKAAEDGFWRERYHPQPDGSVRPEGSLKYCEYPAVLIRVVLENRSWFLRS